jgi:hypothetical protein
MSIGTLIPIHLDGSNSEVIFASNWPSKSNTLSHKIYTDEWYSENAQFQIGGICSKKFISGDYVYGEEGRPLLVKFPMTSTKIRTEIRDSQGG